MAHTPRNNSDDTATRVNYLRYLTACGNSVESEKGDDPYARLKRLVSAARIALVDIDLTHQ